VKLDLILFWFDIVSSDFFIVNSFYCWFLNVLLVCILITVIANCQCTELELAFVLSVLWSWSILWESRVACSEFICVFPVMSLSHQYHFSSSVCVFFFFLPLSTAVISPGLTLVFANFFQSSVQFYCYICSLVWFYSEFVIVGKK